MSAPAPAIAVSLPDGRTGTAVAYDGSVLLIAIELAFAPGQPFSATLGDDPDALLVQGKTVSSKRRQDGAFDVRVRLHSLRREHRSWLEQRFARA